MNLEKLKMHEAVEITQQQATELITSPHDRYDFLNLNESTIDEITEFEQVQNKRFRVEKIGRKGSNVENGYGLMEKASVGVFSVIMDYDFRHPSDFAQNKNSLWRIFTVVI